MDENEAENKRLLNVTFDEDSRSAVNSLILDYYQKFGRKRDLEQFFALSTAQSDIRDPTSLFWRKMKVQSDSSDSGEGKAGSSTELCRISIKCTLPEQSTSQDDNSQSKDDSVSPPIITEEPVSPLQTDRGSPTQSDNESMKSDDNNSQKSTDAHLETSINKPISPTSSITSQRKLEWDSLGDVGYGNESERKISGSNLSTLERLALHQQYSNNDSKHNTQIGLPTSQSTPVEQNISQKGKKGNIKKTTKFYKKDVDLVELNVPHSSEHTRLINVNLTKHISFNVDKNGDLTVKDSQEDTNYSPDKVSKETEMTPQVRVDKEIQTSLTQSKTHKDKSTNPIEAQRSQNVCEQRFPILLNLNSLKKRKRKRKLRIFRKKLNKHRSNISNLSPEKSVNQISDAESFEYMPGYIFNQNQRKASYGKDSNSVGNKSSLESSTVFTTDSSKITKNSFSQDLEKSISLLKDALHPKYSNSKLKEKLIKEVVQRLLKAKYSDDDSGNVFLSSLSFNRKKFNNLQSNHTTTSTSDGNNFTNSNLVQRPKKSILRIDKFNPNGMASTSQSTPNLHSFAQNEQQVHEHKTPTSSNTETDFSSRGRNSSDVVPKMSSDELYKKYLHALKKEQAHKKLLKDKETLLKKKLVSSDTCIKALPERNEKTKDRLYRLIKELAQNNMDNGSGDASKVEGRSNSDPDQYNFVRTQRNHSVFTLASGKSIPHSRNSSPKKSQKDKKQNPVASSSKIIDNSCICSQRADNAKLVECPLHNVGCKGGLDQQIHNCCRHNKEDNSDFTVELVQSNKTSPRTTDRIAENTDDIQYVCLCPKETNGKDVPEKLLIYKCSRISQHPVCLDSLSKASSSIGIQCSSNCTCTKQKKDIKSPRSILPDNTTCFNKELVQTQCSSTVICPSRKTSTSSQTHANLDLLLHRESSYNSESTLTSKKTCQPVIMRNNCTLDNQSEGKTNECSSGVCDITRSIQTKICIDPKISNPSISDVKFINDLDLKAKILDDNKIDFSAIGKNAGGSYGDSKNHQLDQYIENKTVPGVHQHQTETYTKRTNDVCSKLTEQSNKQVPNGNQFSIPIHGTNMTLIVSLGSNTENATDVRNVTPKENCITTNKIDPIKKGTVCKADSSKGVQCTSTDFLSPIHKKIDENICNTNTAFKLPHEGESTNISTEDSKYNTYPTKSQSTKKSFVRSNTCTGCLESSFTNIQSDQKLSVETQKDFPFDLLAKSKKTIDYVTSQKSFNDNNVCKRNNISRHDQEHKSKTSSIESKGDIENTTNDPILKIIQDITKRYSKKDMEKSKRKKCFRDIITVLNYLLDTEESSDQKEGCSSSSNTDGTSLTNQSDEKKTTSTKKTYVDKAVQLSLKQDKKHKSCTESSCIPSSSEKPATTDSGTCKVLNKIKRECEKYHQKRCKTHCEHKKCDESSSTSVNCDNCNRVHYCSFRSKYKTNKTKSNLDKGKKKCVAYNLIIQTSDTMTSEGTATNEGCGRPLKNVIVKIPSKHEHLSNAPFNEVSAKIERKLPNYSPRCEGKFHRSKSLPNDSERSSDDLNKTMRTCTVRDYLEINRPDFIEKTTKRQNCLKVIKQTRPGEVCGTSGVKMIVVHTPQCTHTACMDPCNIYCSGAQMYCNPCVNPFIQSFNSEVTGIGETSERTANRRLLSQQLERQQTINTLNSQELQHLAKELGAQLRRKKVAPKFISEREMKKHSEKIYKSLPEVVQKKEQLKKDNIKKTNLLMANIFKKNLQMKTLRGSINLSNYSTVVKI